MSERAQDPAFEAVIVPHRSLSRQGMRWLLGALLLLCAGNAATFVWLGAWPVGGFCGAELLLAAVLLRVNARGARASEVVLLDAAGLSIVRTDRHGARQERRFDAGWLRAELEEQHGRVPRLVLRARHVAEEIGASLGEAEKRDLALALAQALQRRRAPVFDNPQLRPEAAADGQPSSEASDFIRS